jgi:hypothetical protein
MRPRDRASGPPVHSTDLDVPACLEHGQGKPDTTPSPLRWGPTEPRGRRRRLVLARRRIVPQRVRSCSWTRTGAVGEECDCHGSVSGRRTGAIGARAIGCTLTGERQGEYSETGAGSRRGRRLPGASVGGNRTAAALVRELRPPSGLSPALIHQVVLGLRLEPPRGGAATHTYTCTETLPCLQSAQYPWARYPAKRTVLSPLKVTFSSSSAARKHAWRWGHEGDRHSLRLGAKGEVGRPGR